MKFTIEKSVILDELQNLQGIVEKRNTMPILANILLNVTESEIEMTGTDLEVGVKTHIPKEIEKENKTIALVKIEETGTVTVPGKKMFEIVKSIGDGQEITFKEDDNDLKMYISAGDSEFEVVCLSKDDYPVVAEANFKKKIKLPLTEFRKMIDRVFFAIAQEQRYYLNGALLVIKPKSLELVSTDGHRLSYVSKKTEQADVEKEVRVIVAKKTLNEIRKFEGEEIEFDLDENNLFFRCGRRTLISRIIESKFPNYENVIPKDNPHVIILGREKFASAVRRVSLLSAERSKGVKFTVEKNMIRLFSSNPEMGVARDKLAVEYKGPKIDIGFNAEYFLEFLSVVDEDEIRFELKDENSAA
ncbi:MAG: DNA polymerase III subunit beta, partial [Candidatus Aminicenantales bacterium]